VAVAAPQRIGSAPKPPLCEVSRMWPLGVGTTVWTGSAAAEGTGGTGAAGGTGEAEDEGIAVLSTDMNGPQKMQCTDRPHGLQAGERRTTPRAWRGRGRETDRGEEAQAGEERSP
jgi:hypothetical protein